MKISEFKKSAVDDLTPFSTSPQLDADVLIQHAFSYSKTELLLNRDKPIDNEKLAWLNDAVSKRKKGFPIAYITCHKEFYGYDFFVTPAVLIPKPDTEILVERAIDAIITKMEAQQNKILTVCDMCTGSGCIALSVLKSLKENHDIPESMLPKFTLADISQPALEIAKKNADSLLPKSDRVRFIQTNLFEMLPYSFDVIISNPPYIPHKMVDVLLKDGRNEPRLALDGDVKLDGTRSGDDGLEIIRNLIPQAKAHLSPKGTILIETGEYNAENAEKIAQSFGFKTRIHKDLEGQLRIVEM